MQALLIQIREADDIMARHEQACVMRRLAPRAVRLLTHNALLEPAKTEWLDDIDMLILGGSGDYSVHHPESQGWVTPLRHLFDAALQRQMPGLGICFGHQFVGLHLGSRVITDPAKTEIGTVELELTTTGLDCPVFSQLGPRFKAHTGHSDHVVDVPPGVELLVKGDLVLTQGFRLLDAPFYTTQFHPDMTAEDARSRYLAYKASLHDVTDDATNETALRYMLGEDESTKLIGAIVDQVLDASYQATA